MEIPDNLLNFNKICRLCLTEETVMSSIFNDGDSQSNSVPLPLKIMACVSIEVNSTDGLPSQICATCLCHVDGWYKFRDLCENADAVLRKYIKNEPIQVETISQVQNMAQEVKKYFSASDVKEESNDATSGQNKNSSPKKKVESEISEESNEITIKMEDDFIIEEPLSISLDPRREDEISEPSLLTSLKPRPDESSNKSSLLKPLKLRRENDNNRRSLLRPLKPRQEHVNKQPLKPLKLRQEIANGNKSLTTPLKTRVDVCNNKSSILRNYLKSHLEDVNRIPSLLRPLKLDHRYCKSIPQAFPEPPQNLRNSQTSLLKPMIPEVIYSKPMSLEPFLKPPQPRRKIESKKLRPLRPRPEGPNIIPLDRYCIMVNDTIEKPVENVKRNENVVENYQPFEVLELKTSNDEQYLIAEEVNIDDTESPLPSILYYEGSSREKATKNAVQDDAEYVLLENTDNSEPSSTNKEVHKVVVENCLYSFRLDEDGNIDLLGIVENQSKNPEVKRGSTYACVFCCEVLKDKTTYDRHVKKLHQNYLKCKVCDKQLTSLRNFLLHTAAHSGIYTFTCPICQKKLTRGFIFRAHVKHHYQKEGYKCKICNKELKNYYNFRKHVSYHSSKKALVCEICGFSTHYKLALNHHIMGHLDKKEFMCEWCGRQFNTSQNLEAHRLVHIKPVLPCQFCKKVYRSETAYDEHLQLRHSEKIKDVVKDKDEDKDKNEVMEIDTESSEN